MTAQPTTAISKNGNNNGNKDREFREMLGLGQPIAFYPTLARAFGTKCGVMLSQLIYWTERVPKERDGWFYKSVEELTAETGLGKEEQATARAELQSFGIIDAILKGWPRRWYYRVNVEKLRGYIIGGLSQPTVKPANGKTSQRQNQPTAKPAAEKPGQNWAGKSTNIGGQTPPMTEGDNNELNTENTSEIKTETTSSLSSSYESSQEPGRREEEVSFKILDSALISKIVSLGVFEGLLPEIDKSGWTIEELNALADSVKGGNEPGGLFMFRLRKGKKPRISKAVEPTHFVPADVQRQMNAKQLAGPFREAYNRALNMPMVGIEMIELESGTLIISATDEEWERLEPVLKKIEADLADYGITQIDCLEA